MENVALLPPPLILPTEPVLALAVLEPKVPRSARSSRSAHYPLLIAITLLGGILRFGWLDRPAIWGDEALTYGRICGTFAQLLDKLQDAGFAPLHYELYWWIGQHATLTPIIMRLIPAIAGTLMVPAMYWLAVQLAGRRVALLSALLTATSAYLLNYSRDAKMYSHFWLFCVLNMAALLWWLRVRARLSWCVWVTTGTAMVGFQAIGWIVVVVELLIVLSSSRANWLSLGRLLVMLLCVTIALPFILAPFVLLLFVEQKYFADPMALLLLIVICMARLIGFTLKRVKRHVRNRQDANRWLMRISQIPWPSERALVRGTIAKFCRGFAWPPLALFVLGVCILAAGPFGYYHDFNQYVERLEDRGWAVTGISWVQAYNYGRSGPMLIGYTASAYFTGWEWPRTSDEARIPGRTLLLLKAGTLAIAAGLALGLVPWWRRRATAVEKPSPQRGWRAALWIVLWITLPAYAFYCVSITAHEEPRAWLIHLFQWAKTAPWAWAAAAVLAVGWFLIGGKTWGKRLLRAGQLIAISVVTFLLLEGIFKVYPSVDSTLSAHSRGWQQHGSVWMPRYLAIMLPAVLIVTSILLSRLPTRPLRWGAILLFIGVNLAVHGSRVLAGSEPPMPLIIHDLISSQPAAGTSPDDVLTRTYFEPAMQNGTAFNPGEVSLHSMSARYYAAIFTGMGPNDWARLAWPGNLRFRIWPQQNAWNFSAYIINEVPRLPKLRSFTTWEVLEPRELNLTDKPLDALEPRWRLQSEQEFTDRDHWRWIDICVLRRRVYVRNEQPATRPSTRPTK